MKLIRDTSFVIHVQLYRSMRIIENEHDIVSMHPAHIICVGKLQYLVISVVLALGVLI